VFILSKFNAQVLISHQMWGRNSLRTEKAYKSKKGKLIQPMQTLIGSKNLAEDLKEAVVIYKWVLAAFKYHQDKNFGDILKKQVLRVGNMFDALDKSELPNRNYASTTLRPYTSQDLKKEWDEFVTDHTKEVISETTTWLIKWKKEFKAKKEDLKKLKANKKTSKKDQDEAERFIKVIDKLLEAYKKKGKWTNPWDDKFDSGTISDSDSDADSSSESSDSGSDSG